MRRALLVLPLAAALLCVPGPATGQSSSRPVADAQDDLRGAAAALQDAKRAHLWRVGAWGGANALGGLALVLGSSRSRRAARWNFGAMSAGWGAVNVGIAAVGLYAAGPPPTDPAAVLGAERQFHDILLFNLGLNVAYSAVGGTMLGAGYQDVAHAGRWRGFGTSLILQGAGLLVLDGIAFFASRTRLTSLIEAGVTLSVHPLPHGAALALRF